MVSALLTNTGYRKLWSQFMIWWIIEHKHGFHSGILYLPLNHSQNFNYFLYMSNSSNRREGWPKKDPNSPGISHLWLISLLALTISSHRMAHTRFLFGSMFYLPCYFYPSDTMPELHFLNHVSMVDSVCSAGDPCSISGSGRSPEKGTATYSSILAWRIPWTEDAGRLHPWDRRVGHDGVAHTFTLSTQSLGCFIDYL